MFDLSSSDEQLEQFVSNHEGLTNILQRQQERQKLTKSKNLLKSDKVKVHQHPVLTAVWFKLY